MRIVAIEANVGAGKTTLLKHLASELRMWADEDWTVVEEPADSDPEFKRLLGEALSDPMNPNKRVTFQRYITNQRQNLLKGLPDGNYIIERSLFSDIVFSQMYMFTSEQPDASYLTYYYDIKRRLMDYPHIDVVVYLDRDPEACLDAINKRAREGEHYELHTLVDLKRFHDACLPQITREVGTNLVTVKLGENFALPSVVACDILETIYG